jgi:hypothetical protein
VAIIACDIRRGGRTTIKARLRPDSCRPLTGDRRADRADVRGDAGKCPSLIFVDSGEHVADYVAGEGGVDVAGSEQLRLRGLDA